MENINTSHGEKMIAHIASCKASGMKIRAYCLEHKLTPSNYHYWLAKSQGKTTPSKFISIPVPETNVSVYITFAKYPLYQPLIATFKIGIELCVYGKYKHFSRRKNASSHCQLQSQRHKGSGVLPGA